jgi:hypothetical protein
VPAGIADEPEGPAGPCAPPNKSNILNPDAPATVDVVRPELACVLNRTLNLSPEDTGSIILLVVAVSVSLLLPFLT